MIYAEGEFGKRAMMRHIFNDQTFSDLNAEEEAAFDAKINGLPPPGSSERVAPKKPPGLVAGAIASVRAWGEEAMLLSAFGGLALLMVVGAGAFYYYVIKTIDG